MIAAGSTVTGWGPCRWVVLDIYNSADIDPNAPFGPGRGLAHIACDTCPTYDQDQHHGHGPVAVYVDGLVEVVPADHAALAETEDAALFDLLEAS